MPAAPMTAVEEEGGERQVDGRELAQGYVAMFFVTGRVGEGGLSDEERVWLRDWQAMLSQHDDSVASLVPRLPVVIPKLMAALRDPGDVDFMRVAELIESDPVLSAGVLRVVNSPAMRGAAGDIESVSHAVTRMGSKGLREVIFAAIVSPVAQFGQDARLDDVTLRSIWPLTLRVAMNVKAEAQSAGMSGRGFPLYLAGLAHSTGIMVLLRGLKTLEASRVSAAFLGELEKVARHLSVRIASGWQFDPEAISVLEGWAEGQSGDPAVALLTRAIECGRLEEIHRLDRLEGDFLDAYRECFPGGEQSSVRP